MYVEVKSEAELRDLIGEPAARAVSKERKSLHAHDRAWLAASPFCLEQVFFHCAKSFKRSSLWRPETWPDPAALASMPRIVKDVQPTVTETLAELEEYYGEQYEKQLYGTA